MMIDMMVYLRNKEIHYPIRNSIVFCLFVFLWMVIKQIPETALATELLQAAEIVGQLVLNMAWGLCKDAYVFFSHFS